MATVPWTQSVFLDWRPWLAYWERRVELLRELDKQLDLDEFKLEDDEAGGRWGNEAYEIMLTESTLTLRGNGMEADRESLLKAAGLALDLLKPFSIDEVQVVLGHIAPSSKPAGKLQALATKNIFGDWFPDIGVEDYAVILDGRMKDSEHLAHMEIGILSKSEIPARLAGFAGEEMPASSRGSLRWWAGQHLPESAFFIGSSWKWVVKDQPSPSIKEIDDFWDNALREANDCFQSVPSVAKAEEEQDQQ